jgi:AcrR family transcriptional regulator
VETVLDPRIRRTRQLLRNALEKLLETRDFDKISVQDIADAATVNRVTFYDHYPDRFALLECVVGIRFDGTCSSALTAIVVGVCDYLEQFSGDRQRGREPHLEWAVVAVIRRMLLEGLRRHDAQNAEMRAATASWAIYGAAREWVGQPGHGSSGEAASVIMPLVAPIFESPRQL